VACTRRGLFLLFLRVWVTGLISWSWPVVGRVSGGWLSLGWCLCSARVVHAPAPARFFGDRLFDVSVCIFVFCFLCSLFLSLSVGT
jgi:hypothetical protein